MTLLYEPVIDADAQAAHVDVDLGRLVLPNDLRNPSCRLHRVDAATLLDLLDDMAAAQAMAVASAPMPAGSGGVQRAT